MKPKKKSENFIKQPYYEGGYKAMKAFIQQNLQYPESSARSGVEGQVHLRYDINIHGEVTDVKVIGGLDMACDAEAIRIVKMLKFIVPKNPRNLKIIFHKTMTIHFRIGKSIQPQADKDSEIVIQPRINYTIITEKPTVKPEPQKTTYSYTIKLS